MVEFTHKIACNVCSRKAGGKQKFHTSRKNLMACSAKANAVKAKERAA